MADAQYLWFLTIQSMNFGLKADAVYEYDAWLHQTKKHLRENFITIAPPYNRSNQCLKIPFYQTSSFHFSIATFVVDFRFWSGSVSPTLLCRSAASRALTGPLHFLFTICSNWILVTNVQASQRAQLNFGRIGEGRSCTELNYRSIMAVLNFLAKALYRFLHQFTSLQI